MGDCAHVVLVLCEYIWNTPTVSLALSTFDDTGFLGSPHQVVYTPSSMVPPWVTASHFLTGNKEAELKRTTFSLPLLSVFSCLSSSNPPAI